MFSGSRRDADKKLEESKQKQGELIKKQLDKRNKKLHEPHEKVDEINRKQGEFIKNTNEGIF